MSVPLVQKDELLPLMQAVPLTGADVLDLGCGIGSLARRIVSETGAASVTAIDTDAAQIARGKEKGGGVKYLTGAAEALPLPDASIDVVVMMKSLHHVPIPQMDRAFAELARVLRPGGQMYICEPEYAGPFNDILRLFHDEGIVRAAALKAIKRVSAGVFKITEMTDYLRIVNFGDLEDFRKRMMNLPWLKNRITLAIEAQVAAAWRDHCAADGSAALSSRMLVFVLQKGQKPE
ncbi:MAG: class I SAM-dependent methyltransferase [Rhodobacteraceae bacterium]|nr:class I SAM-dependent methyltransferase [Paracoccaceae bacterium]